MTQNGGPAFPTYRAMEGETGHRIGEIVEGGMSLRDYFASQEQSYPPKAWLMVHFRTDDIEESGVLKHEALARWRYEMADAMLAARK